MLGLSGPQSRRLGFAMTGQPERPDSRNDIASSQRKQHWRAALLSAKLNREGLMSAEANLNQLGLTLPAASSPAGNYVSWKQVGDILYLSGVGPHLAGGGYISGVVGGDLSVEEGYNAARACGLVLLANMRAALGSLDRVARVVKVFGMVRCTPDFGKQPEVINGCTDLFVEVFGEDGRPARSAVGMMALPRGIAVEIEAIVEVER
jgi:enamine deaminase RidA (YjgF/YER057c/UK114 family)